METKFSVLISIHNSLDSRYFRDAMQSVSSQTKQADEIVIVEDGKLEIPLLEVIDCFKKDLNIISVKLEHNLGLALALNEGLKFCSNELVIRVDGDDICLPERFSSQLNYMKERPDIAASSSHVYEFNHDMTIKIGRRVVPIEDETIKKYAKRRSPLNHPATILRKSYIDKVGGYPNLRNGQDYALWSLLLLRGERLGNLDDELVNMRTGSELIKKRGLDFFKKEIELLLYQRRIKFLGNLDFIINFFLRGMIRIQIPLIRSWMYKIIRIFDK